MGHPAFHIRIVTRDFDFPMLQDVVPRGTRDDSGARIQRLAVELSNPREKRGIPHFENSGSSPTLHRDLE